MADDEIYCITTYMVNQKIKNYTKKLIQFLKEKNKQVLLISHHHIPTEFQEMVDYCIYDNRNHLLHENEYKGWIAHKNNLFYVESQEFFPSNSTLACYYFYSALFFSKFINKNIVHFVDYDSILSNIDQYDENYKILKNSEYSSVRYKTTANGLFADTASFNLSKLNFNNFIISEDKLKSLIVKYRTYELLFEKYFLNFEKIYWKPFQDIEKTVKAGLEHVNAIDWICVAANIEENKLYLVIVNDLYETKKHKVIIDEKFFEIVTNRSSWVHEVSNNKNVIVCNEKGDMLKRYNISNINLKEQAAISWITFNPINVQL